MWGRADLEPPGRAEGFLVSDATVGWLIASLAAPGLVQLDAVFVNLTPTKSIKPLHRL